MKELPEIDDAQRLITQLTQENMQVKVIRVLDEFQKGGNEMLEITAQ